MCSTIDKSLIEYSVYEEKGMVNATNPQGGISSAK